MEKQKPQLKPEVAEKFKLNKMDYAGEVNSPKYGLINLATIDLEKAEKLAADKNFLYLVPKEDAAKATAKETAKK